MKTLDKGRVEIADMRKVTNVQKSPNFGKIPRVILDKSPSLLGGKVERFGDISGMIAHWEGQEERMKENSQEGRRKSKMIEELSLVFEGGGESNHTVRPNSWGSEGGRGDMFTNFKMSRKLNKFKVI